LAIWDSENKTPPNLALDTAAEGEPVSLAESGHTMTSFAELPD
jgi:hypothetical protein